MQFTANDFLEESIAERIARILDSKVDKAKEIYKEQDDFTEGMSASRKEAFEEIIDNMIMKGAEECQAVYKAAFLDGLRLGGICFLEGIYHHGIW